MKLKRPSAVLWQPDSRGQVTNCQGVADTFIDVPGAGSAVQTLLKQHFFTFILTFYAQSTVHRFFLSKTYRGDLYANMEYENVSKTRDVCLI